MKLQDLKNKFLILLNKTNNSNKITKNALKKSTTIEKVPLKMSLLDIKI